MLFPEERCVTTLGDYQIFQISPVSLLVIPISLCRIHIQYGGRGRRFAKRRERLKALQKKSGLLNQEVAEKMAFFKFLLSLSSAPNTRIM